jgi:hypothetical protein
MSDLSYTYDGINMSGSDYGLLVKRSPLEGHPDPRLDQHILGGADGAVLEVDYEKPLFFTNVCQVTGEETTESARDDSRRKFTNCRNLLSATGGERLLEIHSEQGTADDLKRGYYAVINGPIQPSQKGTSAIQFNLNWMVPSGKAVALTETTQAVTVDETPEAFLVPASGTLAGISNSKPVYTITQNAVGGVVEVILANSTLGHSATWEGTLEAGDLLRFDADRQYVEINTGAGYVSAMSGMTDDPGFIIPLLEGGSSNSMTLTGLSDASLSLTYRAQY